MWTQQYEDAEQYWTSEHRRPNGQKDMQHCWDHGDGRQEYPGISPFKQSNDPSKQGAGRGKWEHWSITMSYCSCGVVIQVSFLNWRQWWVPEWWWIGHLFSMFVWPEHAQWQWICSKNGNQWQTMYDGVRHTCRFLDSEQKHLIGEVCLQASDCFRSKA